MKTQRQIQNDHPEIPRYSVIPHEVWSVVEFVDGKSRNLGDGQNARLAFEMADRLAKANNGMATICGGAGFSAESNYSSFGRQGRWDPAREMSERLSESGGPAKTFVGGKLAHQSEPEKENPGPG